MSEADKMLDELGYRKYSEDEDKIIYKYDRETFRISLTFDKRSFKKTFYATEGLWVANDDDWYTKKFKNEWDKYNASQGYWSNIWHEFDMQELQAINKKCEELRMDIEEQWREKTLKDIQEGKVIVAYVEKDKDGNTIVRLYTENMLERC